MTKTATDNSLRAHWGTITRICEQRQAAALRVKTSTGKTRRLTIDAFTAGMLKTVHDAVSPVVREKFLDMHFMNAIAVGWKIVARRS